MCYLVQLLTNSATLNGACGWLWPGKGNGLKKFRKFMKNRILSSFYHILLAGDPVKICFSKSFILFGIFTYWHQRCHVLRWLGVSSISGRVWKMSIFQIPWRHSYKLHFSVFGPWRKRFKKLVLPHFEGWEYPHP